MKLTFGLDINSRVQRGSNLNQIPLKSDALFWLDGSISGNTFVDKSGNERHFTITGKDFTIGWARGFPYKSAATISAPVGDATLIASDVNNYLYASDGTPNQISVVSLFQDIDYAHKLFSRHAAQIVDINGVEIFEPRVVDIVLYNTVKTDASLVLCQTYFAVTTEDVVSVRWLNSEEGNDTTGNSTKLLPWKTLEKSRLSGVNGETIYLTTGEHAFSTGFISQNKIHNHIGVGRYVISGTTGTYLLNLYAANKYKGLNIVSQKSYIFLFSAGAVGDVVFEKCNINTSGGNLSVMNALDLNGNVQLINCIIKHDLSLIYLSTKNNTEIKGNLISNLALIINYAGTSLKVHNNKFTVSLFNPNDSCITNFRSTFEYIGNIMISRAQNGHQPFRTLPDGTNLMNNGKVNYNYLESDQTAGSLINIGNEYTYVNIHDNTEVIGNHLVGCYKNRPAVISMLHNTLIGCGINNIVKYNLSSWGQYGHVIKTGLQQAYTAGGVFYNVVKNCTDGIYFRGVGGCNCFNNTLINDTVIAATPYYTGFNCDENSVAPGNYTENIIFKNNIIVHAVTTAYLIKLDAHAAANGCAFDYNIYYSASAKPFLVGGVQKTWVEWQDLGFDAHSVMITSLAEAKALFTDFDNADYSLAQNSAAIGAGVALDAAYDAGLSSSTNWGNSERVPAIVTKQQGASWDCGAYVH